MATYNKINDWVDYEGEDVDLASDELTVILSNTAPSAETSPPNQDGNGVLANVTQIAYTNLSSRVLQNVVHTQTAGVAKLDFDDLVISASGGDSAAFRYVYICDTTLAGNPLIMWADYGESIVVKDGENFTVRPHADGLYNKS